MSATKTVVGGAAVLGVVAGVLGRGLPLRLADAITPDGSGGAPCGMEEVLRCAFERTPGAIGTLVRLALTTAAICILLAAVGVALAAWAVTRIRRAGVTEPFELRRWPEAAAMGVGTALTVPAVWLLATLVAWLL